MSGPDTVRIKRKRSEQAPETLLVEQPGKKRARPSNDNIAEYNITYVLKKDKEEPERDELGFQQGRAEQSRPTNDTAYVIKNEEEPEKVKVGFQNAEDTSGGWASTIESQAELQDGQTSRTKGVHVSGSGVEVHRRARRTFHLKRPTTPEMGLHKKKSKQEPDFATFVEKLAKRPNFVEMVKRENSTSSMSVAPVDAPFKRPGRGAAVRHNPEIAHKAAAKSTSHLEAMADSLHHFAMEEAAKETFTKPKVTSRPKLPPQRSRELHLQRTSHVETAVQDDNGDGDVEMEDESDYVYDIYVLAPSSDLGATQIDAQDALGQVGYLVITEEDQDVWETYMEDEPSEKDWNSDEDDENHEDWYGADYPDEELASDDEYDRNPYGYRGGAASDDEGWEDTGTWSDDEYERQTQPWRKKTPHSFSNFLSTVEKGDDAEEEQ